MKITVFFSKQSNLSNSLQYSLCTHGIDIDCKTTSLSPIKHTLLASHSCGSPTPPSAPVAAHQHRDPGHTAIAKHSQVSQSYSNLRSLPWMLQKSHTLYTTTLALISDSQFSPGSTIDRPALLHLCLKCSHRSRNGQTSPSLSSEQCVCSVPAAGIKQSCFQHLQASRTVALVSFNINISHQV